MEITQYWPSTYIRPVWLPDWKEKSEYKLGQVTEYHFDAKTRMAQPVTITTSKSDFAWEFLRRNPLYQKDYQRIVELAKHDNVSGRYLAPLGFNIHSLDDNPPPSISFHAKLYKTLCKWGFNHYLLDPSLPTDETAAFDAMRRLGYNFPYPSAQVEATPVVGNSPDESVEYIPIDGGIVPTENETFWLFNTSLPIEQQIQKAREFLENIQKGMYGKKKQASKAEPAKFIDYLRILDADATFVPELQGLVDKSLVEKAHKIDEIIMDCLFPGKNEISHFNAKGELYRNDNHRNPGRDILKNYRKAAYYMRDEGFHLFF